MTDRPAPASQPSPRGRLCQVCGQPPRTPWARYCVQHAPLAYESRRDRLTRPKDPFNAFIYARYQLSLLSIAAFAGQCGISRTAMTNVLRGHRPERQTWEQLHRRYEDLPQTTLANAGWHERGVERAKARGFPTPGTAAHQAWEAARSAGLKGRPKDPAAVAQGVKTRQDQGVYARVAEVNRALSGRRDVQARRGLGQRLRKTPSPTPQQLAQWEQQVAARLATSVPQVRAWWRPLLLQRGLKGPRGRPLLVARCQLVRRLLGEGQAWRAVAQAVARAEGRPLEPGYAEDKDAAALRRWEQRHRPRCRCDAPPD